MEELATSSPGETPLPWERHGLGGEKDSDESFEAFEIYRNLGLQRSFAKVAAQLGKSAPLIERWGRRDNWRVRVQSWDRHSARIINEKVLLGTAAMRERAAGIGLNLQVMAAKRLMKMTEEEIQELSVGQMAMMIRVGQAVESSARAISPEEIDGAIRDTAPTFNIGFVQNVPSDMVAVRLTTGESGYIPLEQVPAFRADYPDATVIA